MGLYKILKKPFFGQFMLKWKNPLSDKETATWFKTWIKSKTKAQLRVWYKSTSQKDVKATIVLAHSMGKPAKGEFLKTGYADELVANGYNVVLFDFNGFGESSMGNWMFHNDVLAVRDFTVTTFPKTDLYYHGVSFGSNWGTVVITEPDNPFKKIILESSPVNLPEFWIHFPFAYRMLKFFYVIGPFYKRYANFEEHLRHTKNCDHILLITSDADIYTPVSMAERMKEAANTKAEVKIFHGSRHALAILRDRDTYIKTVLDFFG